VPPLTHLHHYVCVSVCYHHRGRESHLTITVSPEFNGVDVVCRSTNIVEDEPDSEVATETLKVLGKHFIDLQIYNAY
jgi:hypothetical protein